MRGRIRSFQLRLNEAWKHFERASKKSDRARDTIPNLVRKFLLQIYIFENALLCAPVDRTLSVPYMNIPELPDDVFERYPEVRFVVNVRINAEASLRLHIGDYYTASSLFGELVEEHGGSPDASLSVYYCGLAAAQFNLGLEDLCRKNLENAGLAVRSGGSTLNKLTATALLHSLHLYLEEPQVAKEWKEFLCHIDCPQSTKEAFLKRERLILKRCARHKCLVLI
jgi:hypothetical protein